MEAALACNEVSAREKITSALFTALLSTLERECMLAKKVASLA